jgi:hypothetical protein
MANRVMKQKSEKGKKQARDASEARKYGVRDTASYRKEMLHTTERPKKKDREAQDISDAQSRATAVNSVAGNKGTLKPLEIKESDRELKSSAGHQDVKPIVEKKAKRAQAERELGTGLSRVSKGGDIRPLVGREAQIVKNDLAANDKQLVKEANKRAAARDEKVSKVDLTPEQKAGRIARRSKAASKAKAANAAKTVGKLPEAQTDRPSTKPLKVKKVNGESIATGGAQIIPGEGKAGILNPGNVARTAGEIPNRLRRRIERKAARNVKKANMPGASEGYKKAALLGTRTSEVLNARSDALTEGKDSLARRRAAQKDAKKDRLKKGILTEAEKMPEGPSKEAARRAGESIIQNPIVVGRRGGMHEPTSIPDGINITKTYKRLRPVGKPRLTDLTEGGLKNEKIQMSQQGEITTQPSRAKFTPTGVLGSHEDRLHALTKMFQVPAGEGKTHDLEPVHLRSYLKHKSTNANVKFNERDVVGAVFHAKKHAPDTFANIHKEVLEHRTKRIGQTNEQRERAAAKAGDIRSMTRADRGGKRQAPRAKRVRSNVESRYTEVPNGGKEA